MPARNVGAVPLCPPVGIGVEFVYSLNLCFAVEVNAGAEGGLDENIVEGQLGKSVCENIDLRGHIEAVIENQALFAAARHTDHLYHP